MLEENIKEQLRNIFADLAHDYIFDIHVADGAESAQELTGFLSDVTSTSDKLSSRINKGEGLMFRLLKDGTDTGISFRGIPTGHEFTSLLLAILNSDGKGKNMPDDFTRNRVAALKGPVHLTTYISLSCTNCPDIVQALNIMAVLNPGISHEMVDGALNEEEVTALKIQGVPAVYADGEFIHSGRGDFAELLAKLEVKYGSAELPTAGAAREYDVIVVGGGPAGSSAAIYSARKGLRVAVLATNVGGQVRETVGIENLISTPKTSGKELALDLKRHMQEYPIDIYENRMVENVSVTEGLKEVTVKGGEKFTAPALIIATGASWRRLGVEGESSHIGKGVAFCPHCDGPFYKDRHVAVVGGGNSGIEAAIDLAGICSKVTVFEFMEELKADTVLQDKVRSLPNVEIFVNSETREIVGDGQKVSGMRVRDRATGEERAIGLDGVFVQIGLSPNSEKFRDLVAVNRHGEIEVDAHCRTSVPGIYAAGDVTTVPYKQIVIAMGEGAKAALSAFEDRIKGVY